MYSNLIKDELDAFEERFPKVYTFFFSQIRIRYNYFKSDPTWPKRIRIQHCNYELYSYLYSWMSHTPIVFPHSLPPEIHSSLLISNSYK
jgi:hypothetical protein